MYSLELFYANIYLNVPNDFKNSMGSIKSSVTFLVVPPKDGFALMLIL